MVFQPFVLKGVQPFPTPGIEPGTVPLHMKYLYSGKLYHSTMWGIYLIYSLLSLNLFEQN